MANLKEQLIIMRPGACDMTDVFVEELLAMYAAVEEAVAGTDNDPLWVIGKHPSAEQLRGAAATGSLFVGMIDDQLAGALIVDSNQAPGYENVSWQIEAAPDAVAVMHLFGIHPSFRGKGLARPLVEAAARAKRADGFTVLRLDTLIDNLGAQRTYTALGFTNIGRALLSYGPYANITEPNFVMFEKAL